MYQYDHEEMMSLLLDFGKAMRKAGAEIWRVEDSLSRLAASYGAVKTEVFAITFTIVLTVRFPDGTESTHTRRFPSDTGTDLNQLERLNALSRRCAQEPIPLAALREELHAITEEKQKSFIEYFGSALAASAFCLFFGGNFREVPLTALFAILICFLQRKLKKLCPNHVFFLFAASLICGIGICLSVRLFPFLRAENIMMGDIMLLIPGIAITSAARDMLIGDTISGFTVFLQSLFGAAALASGFLIAILFVG